MKTIRLLLLVMIFGVVPCGAQEFALREVQYCVGNDVQAGKPVDVTKKRSEVALRYEAVPAPVFGGDYLTGFVFRGYNPGEELKRHFTVKVSVDIMEQTYSTVFDDDYTIPSGGTKEDCIPLLTISFSSPLLVKQNMARLNVNIVSTGEAASEPVYFEQNVTEYSTMPAIQLNVKSEVAYCNGLLKNQDGSPVVGARVIYGNLVLQYEGISNSDGQYTVRLEDANAPYLMRVSAKGYPEYETASFYLKDPGFESPNLINPPTELMLTNRLDFQANRQATIILPVAPDASWGRYYRLDRHEGSTIIFEREQEPKSNVPYVIFPDKDFSVSLSEYDLTQLPAPERVRFPDTEESSHTGFYGLYESRFIGANLYDGEHAFIIDSTADCTEINFFRYQVGAFRGYLVLNTISPDMLYDGPKYVFTGEQTGITEAMADCSHASSSVFDLQGRRVGNDYRSPSTVHRSPLRKGVYIQDGRKRVVK